MTGKTLHFVVDVSFKPPAHSSPSSACKGKVEVAEEVKGDQKAPHWAGRLSVLKGLCDAKVKGTLPAALLNHKLPFDIDFDGNGVVAPFSKAGEPETQPAGRLRQGQGPSGTGAPALPGPGDGPTSVRPTPRPTGTGKASRRAVGSSSTSRSKAVPSEPTSARPGT